MVMARSIHIFVDSDMPLEDFIRETESLLGIKLQPVFEGGETWYEFRNSQVVLSIGSHEYENDRDMNFENFRYDIEVRALNINTEEERKKWREDFALLIFNKLKGTNKY